MHPRMMIVGMLAGCLLGGCGSNTAGQALPIAEPTSSPPTAVGPVTSTPPPSADALAPEPVEAPVPTSRRPPVPTASTPAPDGALFWPAAGASDVARLQSSVDGGSEPWLLDPTEVALSYATTVHGWTAPQARTGPGGRTVEIADGSRRLVLRMAQPVRSGTGGIWVVTGESPAG